MHVYLKSGFNQFHKIEDGIIGTGKTITFEASVHYYHHRIALENLKYILPCSKLIWVLRNPLPRAVSEYLHQAVKAKAYPSFHSLLFAELAAIKKCKTRNLQIDRGFDNQMFKCLAKFKLKKFLLSTAFYAYFISAWLRKFPVEQNLFLDYEKFKLNPQYTVEQISSFLGLAPAPLLNYTWKYNKANTRDGKARAKRTEIRFTANELKIIRMEILPYVEGMYDLIKNDFGWRLDSLE